MDTTERLIDSIRESIIGDDEAIEGPFGLRRLVYSDYTASGRSLRFLEDFIRAEVLPLYANTHTETSGTGLQTTRFREDAREIIARAVGATADDAVLFCGSGATGAIHKLIEILNWRIPADMDAQFALRDRIPDEARPVVFVGPYEHHSNELPWRESIADVVTIDEDADGRLDMARLEQALVEHRDRPLKVGCFSAASNVTGIETDTIRVARLLHEHGALSFWDFAAAGPYVKIEMNPRAGDGPGDYSKDAIFLSPHKFIGGPETPGVLVAKRRLFRNTVPSTPGGGTVSYVSPTKHRYVTDLVQREEGGTPAIIGSIRAGLVFQLKEAVGTEEITRRERSFIRRAIASWSRIPNLRILGNPDAERLGIVSFMLGYGDGYLHHNFVVALLNDLFGIQARGGCSCAGPYGHRLLDIDASRSRAYERLILRGYEGIKPGWVRINFNYFISDTVFRYIIDAVDFVAREGFLLLPDYAFDPESGNWHHRRSSRHGARRLGDVSYASGRLEYSSRHASEPESVLASYLDLAATIVAGAGTEEAPPCEEPALDDEFESLRWFPLPGDGPRARR